jgi:hypothetical protein
MSDLEVLVNVAGYKMTLERYRGVISIDTPMDINRAERVITIRGSLLRYMNCKRPADEILFFFPDLFPMGAK